MSHLTIGTCNVKPVPRLHHHWPWLQKPNIFKFLKISFTRRVSRRYVLYFTISFTTHFLRKGRIQRGDHWNLLGKWRHGGGGDRESHQMLFGGITSRWSNIQRRDRLNFTLFSPKSSDPPQAINNNRSLSDNEFLKGFCCKWNFYNNFWYICAVNDTPQENARRDPKCKSLTR